MIPRKFSLALLLLCWLAAPASAASLTVLAPASATPGLKALAAQFSAKTGTAVSVGGGGREKVLEILGSGGAADVVVLPTSDLIETPRTTGMTPLGHILVGVGVKAGAKVPDISTPEKFRAALLAAGGRGNTARLSVPSLEVPALTRPCNSKF